MEISEGKERSNSNSNSNGWPAVAFGSATEKKSKDFNTYYLLK